MATVLLKRQFGDYTIAQLPVLAPIPTWCDGVGFVNITRGDDELSVICLKERVPATVTREGEWGCFKVDGSALSGEAANAVSVVKRISEVGIDVLAISTFDGTYLLIQSHEVTAAVDLLTAGDHCVVC